MSDTIQAPFTLRDGLNIALYDWPLPRRQRPLAVVLIGMYVIRMLAQMSKTVEPLRVLSLQYHLGSPLGGDFPWTAFLLMLDALTESHPENPAVLLAAAEAWAAAERGMVVVCGSLFLAGAALQHYGAFPWRVPRTQDANEQLKV